MGYDLFFELYGNTKRDTGGLMEAIAAELAPEYCIRHRVFQILDNSMIHLDPNLIEGKLREVTELLLERNEFMEITFGSSNEGPWPYQINASLDYS